MIETELTAWQERLEGRSALEILTAAAERFAPRITFTTGFGVEGCVIVDLIARHRLPIDICTLDTGLFFPETYELWRRLEEHYGLRIRAVRPEWTLEEQARHHGEALWERDPDRCCEIRKVQPLERALYGFDAWVTAIRRDQTLERRRARVVENDPRRNVVKINPLLAWTTKDVWDYVHRHGVPYNPLHDRGYPSIGCMPCTTPVLDGEDPRAGRWRGRVKTECGLHSRQSEPRPDGFIVWFTGMSGAGKSTLATALRRRLENERRVEILDGDEVRTELCRGLGYSREDRDENVRRIGYVSRVLARNGVVAIAAAISPYRAARQEVRQLAEREGIPFIEVHVHAELDALVQRDVKGLYRRALAGEIPNFTGVSDPYEPPSEPEVTVRTDRETVDESLARILDVLRERGLHPVPVRRDWP